MGNRLHPLGFAFLATASLAAAAPAEAAPVWAKTDAILGGQPSALQAILQEQRALPARSAATLRPASLSLPTVTPALVRPRRAIASDRPDVFGSVALGVGRTPLTARWRKVERMRLGGAPARFADKLADTDRVETLEAVNRYVNGRVRFVDDARQYGRADLWTAAADTLTRGRGDCEDYAIAKFQMLRRAGFADRDLYLVIVKDLVRRSDHAVLVARADDRLYVLDNGTDRLLESDAVRDYRPILTFSANGAWTHGYRIEREEIEIAERPEVETLAPAGTDQRSWSASFLALSTGFSK